MLLQKILVLFFGTVLSFCCAYTYIGTEDSLRENLQDLVKGNLKFSDDNTPPYEGELSDITPKNNSEYDFIVVGAGSSGSVIASRLSDNKSYTVLLIEAGSKEYPIMDIPLLTLPLQTSEEINWNFATEPSNNYCLGLKDQRCHWPAGKVMGGNSVLSFMFTTRGYKKDYDGWAKVTGDESWSSENMFKYFKKLQNLFINNDEFEGLKHNFDHNEYDPLNISSPSYDLKFDGVFIEASKELGYPETAYNHHHHREVPYFHLATGGGEKWSTNRVYLYRVKNRTNLFLTRESHVDKILINNNDKRAHAVQLSKFGKSIVVKARKEIIVSAGALNTPKILMLSGIGPAQHLRDLDIEVVKDAPVGENLMDHVAYGGLIFKMNYSKPISFLELFDPKNPAIKTYINKRRGALSDGAQFESLIQLNVDDPNSVDAEPNCEFLFSPTSGIKDPVVGLYLGISEEYRNKMLLDQFNHSSWTTLPMIMEPKSRGKLLLRSKDPNAKPKLYSNYFDHPDDVRALIKGIRQVIKLSKTQAFQKYGSELYKIPLPCERYDFDTDEFWECAIRTYTMTFYHYSGTCKMGREDDKTAVLNSQLQVMGIKNLRVVDASIMPSITSDYPFIPMILVAEKMSDEIKEFWR